MNNQLIADPGALLDGFRSDIIPLLQENGQSYDRLKATFIIAVQQNPDILKCTPESLRREISKCAADGLVPDSKEAVLLPYFDNKEKVFLANYQPMVYGVIKRMKELGGVFSIVCNLVFAKDEFDYNEADPDSLVHKSDRFSSDRGDVVGGYVIFRDEKKRLMHIELMSVADFLKVQQASKAPNSPAWRIWRDEMYKKAVLRRGAKYISINNDKIRTLIERQDSMFDSIAVQRQATERFDPFSGEVIEGEVAGSTRQIESKPTPGMQPIKTDEEAKAPASKSSSQQEGRSQKRSDPAQHGEQEKRAEPEKPSLADKPPAIPETDVFPADIASMTECAQKVFAIALDMNLDPRGRREILKEAPANWKPLIPDTLHPLLKSIVEVVDWCLKRDVLQQPWQADHALAVNKVKNILGIEKLDVGKYPDY